MKRYGLPGQGKALNIADTEKEHTQHCFISEKKNY